MKERKKRNKIFLSSKSNQPEKESSLYHHKNYQSPKQKQFCFVSLYLCWDLSHSVLTQEGSKIGFFREAATKYFLLPTSPAIRWVTDILRSLYTRPPIICTYLWTSSWVGKKIVENYQEKRKNLHHTHVHLKKQDHGFQLSMVSPKELFKNTKWIYMEAIKNIKYNFHFICIYDKLNIIHTLNKNTTIIMYE